MILCTVEKKKSSLSSRSCEKDIVSMRIYKYIKTLIQILMHYLALQCDLSGLELMNHRTRNKMSDISVFIPALKYTHRLTHKYFC